MHQSIATQHRVKTRVREWKALRIALLKASPRQAATCYFDCLCRKIEPCGLGPPFRRSAGQDARTTTYVQHAPAARDARGIQHRLDTLAGHRAENCIVAPDVTFPSRQFEISKLLRF